MKNNGMLPGLGDSFDENYTIEFCGESPVLASHKIDVREYVASLWGYDGVVRHIAKHILRADVKIIVVAERKGSLESHVQVVLDTLNVVASVAGILSFFGVTAKDMGNALSSILSGVVKKYKKYSGDMKKVITEIIEYSVLSDEDKEKLITALDDEEFLESLDKFTSPLDSPGYDQITVSSKHSELFSVHKSERGYFRFIPPAGEITDYFEDTVEIIYISPELIRWRFKGKEKFWADVLDVEFLNFTGNIKPSELKGRKYIANGRKVSRRKLGGKKWVTDWYIDKIEEYQTQLPLI